MATDWGGVVDQWAAANAGADPASAGGNPTTPAAAGNALLGAPAPAQADVPSGVLGGGAPDADAPPAAQSDLPAAPDPAANPWDGTVDQFHDMRVQASQAALYAAKDVHPAKAGQALDLSQQTGAPLPAVLADVPGYQAQAQANSNTAILKSDPVLADWLAQNPVAPQVASDDLANLSIIGRMRREIASGWAQGPAGQQLGRDYYAGQTAATSPEVADLERTMQANGPFDSGIVHGMASFAGQMADLFTHAAPLAGAGAIAGGGLGALATGAPTGGLAAPVGAAVGAGVGAAAGFGAGVFSDTFKSWVGNYLHSSADVVDASGNHLDPTVRLGTAMLGGLVNAGLNTFGLHIGLPGAGQAASTMVDEALSKAVARPTVASALGNLAGDLATKGLTGAATGAVVGAAMGGVDVLADQTTRMLSGGNFETIFNDPAQRAAAVDELEQNIASMALMMGSTHAIAPFGSFARDVLQARQAAGDMASFQSLEQGAAASAVRTRAPSVFQDWMERQQPDGTGADSLYVPAQRVADLYQRYGIEPDGNDGLLGPVAPDIRDQLAQGLPAGGDVVLPMSAFVTHLAGSDVSRELQPDLRTRADGMSLRDAEQFRVDYQDAMARAGADADQQAVGQPATSRDAISDDVFSQARQAGFTNDASRQYAALVAARYATRGERLGVDPMQLYREEGLTIRSADQQPATPPPAPDGLDIMLNALRSNRGEPPESLLRGQSLMQFLARRGGVVDQGGELSGVGADKWHIGKPGQRRFIRPPTQDAGAALPGFEGSKAVSSEYGLEGAAEAAHEAGYLPDAEPGTLVEAVRREVGGEPVHAERAMHQRRVQFREAADDLSEALAQLDIDPATATNAEIRRALAPPAEPPSRGVPSVRARERDASMPAAPEEIAPAFVTEAADAATATDAAGVRRPPVETITRDTLEAKSQTGDTSRPGELNADAMAEGFHRPIADAIARGDRVMHVSGEGHETELTSRNGRTVQVKDGAGVGWIGMLSNNTDRVEIRPGERSFDQPAAAEPVARITGEELGASSAPFATRLAAAKSAFKRMREMGPVHNAELGDIQISGKSTGKTFNRITEGKLVLLPALREIIAGGRLAGTVDDRGAEQNVRAYHRLEATVRVGDADLRASVIVREDNNGRFYYDLEDRTASRLTVDARPEGEEGGSGATGAPAGIIPETAAEQGAEGSGHPANPPLPPRSLDQKVVAPNDGVNLDVRRLDQPDGSAGVAPTAEARGSIRLSDGEQLITLFKQRDLSTLLHEAGHGWLDEMTRDAERPDAPQQVRDDMRAIMQWMGVTSADQIGVEQHELFARGVEAYLMEGTAPSEALRGPFQRFRAWLTRIYKSLTALRVPMDPEIRGVMDRLLATDDEIAATRGRQGLDGMFRSAAEAGMTDAEFAGYTAAVDRARGEARDGLTNRVLRDVRRQRTAEWQEQEAPVRDEVTREVDATPAERALRLIRTGKLDGVDGPGQRMRLSRDAITEMYGTNTVLDLLPKGFPPIYSAEGGLDPDMMASMLGMRSGDDLLRALMQHEAQRRSLREQGETRSPRQYAIDSETYTRMVDRHGDALADGSIEAEALDEVHSERQMEVLGTEMRALARRARKTATPTSLARAWAERTIGDKRVGDATKPNTYARAESKAGAAAMKALLAGDHAEAFRQKQAQLLNHALYLEAKAAKVEVDRGRALFARFGASPAFPGIEHRYVDRIHDLLRRFEIPSKRDPAELDRALGPQTLEGWATQRIAEGKEIVIAPDLYDGTYARPVDTLSVDQFRALAETVRSIAHVGREEQTVTMDGIKAERADVVAQMLGTMADLPTHDVRDFANQGGATGIRGSLEGMGKAAGAFHAMLLKPEAIIDRLDRDDPNGIFNRAVWRPIKAAQAMEGDLRAEMVGRMRTLRETLGKGYGKDFDRTLPDQPELIDQRTGKPMALKKRGLIAMALNTGSESNFDRLTEGYGWSREGVQAALDRNLSAADWRYVQGIWDTFDSLFPRIEAMQRRMTGVGLEKVEAREVQTAHGTFRGGYFPVVYDPNLSQLGDRIRASGEQRFEADYVRATTPKGHTIARVNYVGEPLSLNPDIIHWKLGQAIHDLAYREAIVQADRLLRDGQVVGRMDETIGRDQRRQLDRWLQGVANAPNIDTRGLGAMDAFLHRLRLNSMIVGIGFRATTMLKHGITALSNSIGELGPGWMMKGTTEFFGSPDRMRRNYAMITGKSAEMRQRFNAVDRDVRDVLGDLSGKSSVLADAERFGHYGVAMLDMLSALPTWLGAYRKAETGGMVETDAVAFADKTVRNAHGAQGSPDLAAIQRGSEAQKLFTMFYGFFNHIYNRQVVGVRAAGSMVRNVRLGDYASARTDFAKTLSTFTFYLAMPALIEGLVAQGGPGDDDDWLGWAAKQIASEVPAGLPVMRDMAKAAIEGRGYEMSPVGHAVDEVVKGGRELASAVGLSDKPVSDRWLQHAIEAPGYVLGLPTGQVAGSAQFLANVAGGDEDPQTVADWMRGLVYGPAPKRPAQ